jgi:hypothetical protein
MNSYLRWLNSFLASTSSFASARNDVEESFEFTASMSDTQTLDLIGVNGAVEVQGTQRPEIRLKAIKRGAPDDISQVTIQVERTSTGFLARTVYPRRWSFGPSVAVDFQISIPAGCTFRGKTGNGRIRVSSVAGFVRADSSNGTVDVLNANWVEANTGNGAICATLTALDPNKSVLLKTFNGRIRVGLPLKCVAELNVSTRNGRVSSHFPLSACTEQTRSFLRGRIGTAESAAAQVICETQNGNIYIDSLCHPPSPITV